MSSHESSGESFHSDVGDVREVETHSANLQSDGEALSRGGVRGRSALRQTPALRSLRKRRSGRARLESLVQKRVGDAGQTTRPSHPPNALRFPNSTSAARAAKRLLLRPPSRVDSKDRLFYSFTHPFNSKSVRRGERERAKIIMSMSEAHPKSIPQLRDKLKHDSRSAAHSPPASYASAHANQESPSNEGRAKCALKRGRKQARPSADTRGASCVQTLHAHSLRQKTQTATLEGRMYTRQFSPPEPRRPPPAEICAQLRVALHATDGEK